jgi:hypothetical protein
MLISIKFKYSYFNPIFKYIENRLSKETFTYCKIDTLMCFHYCLDEHGLSSLIGYVIQKEFTFTKVMGQGELTLIITLVLSNYNEVSWCAY